MCSISNILDSEMCHISYTTFKLLMVTACSVQILFNSEMEDNARSDLLQDVADKANAKKAKNQSSIKVGLHHPYLT